MSCGGKACTGNADCQQSAACVSNVCLSTWVLGFTVSGLPPTSRVTLQNNGGDDLTLTGNGAFAFPTRVTGAYSVAVLTQPDIAFCTVSNGVGTATANVSNVTVSCVPTWAVGGTLTGLPMGDSVTLSNGTDTLTLQGDGSFAFPARTPGAYAVTVQTQPSGASCSVTNGSGTATADVSAVTVTCSSGYSIGGSLTGLPGGASLTLQNNAGDALMLNERAVHLLSVGGELLGDGVGAADGDDLRRDQWGWRGNRQRLQRGGRLSGVGRARPDLQRNRVAVDLAHLAVRLLARRLRRLRWLPRADWPDPGQWRADNDIIVSRVTPAGELDTSFGVNGHVTISTGVAYESGVRIYPSGMGGYVVTGTLAGASDPDFGIAGITPNGMFDPLFGNFGTATYDTGQWEYVEDWRSTPWVGTCWWAGARRPGSGPTTQWWLG